jgi:hypothetical protein
MSANGKPVSNRMLRILLWLVSIAVAGAMALAIIAIFFAEGGESLARYSWEDTLTTFIGVWMIACVPISLMRWVAVPEARIPGLLGGALLGMGLGGVSLVLPVLSEGRIDPALAFGVLVVLFVAQGVITVHDNKKSDELMRRYNADSTLISSVVFISAFSLYAAGERLGVIGTISPWGLVGIACILQFAVAMWVYYRLGMAPGQQEKPQPN